MGIEKNGCLAQAFFFFGSEWKYSVAEIDLQNFPVRSKKSFYIALYRNTWFQIDIFQPGKRYGVRIFLDSTKDLKKFIPIQDLHDGEGKGINIRISSIPEFFKLLIGE